MTRSVSAGLSAELSAAVTAPGYLLQIDWSSPMRWCTRTTLNFGGASFTERGFTVNGLLPGVDSSGSNSGSVQIHDPDAVAEYYVNAEGIEEKRIRIWAYSGDVVGSTELDLDNPVLLFDGYAQSARVDPARASVTIQLQDATSRMAVSPRIRITKELGFTHLPVKGQEYEFGGEKWKAEPED